MYRDDLLAAQMRVGVLENELRRRADHESELKRLRLQLSRFRAQRMPRVVRLLHLGLVGASIGTGYLLLAMSLIPLLDTRVTSTLQSSIFLPWVGAAIFAAMLPGLRGLARESFERAAPFWAVTTFFGLALLTPLLPLNADVRQVTQAFLWAGAQLLFGYLALRSPRVPRPLAVGIAAAFLASAIFGTVSTINDIFWLPYIRPFTLLYQESARPLLAATLASGGLAALLVAVALHLMRVQLLSRAWGDALEKNGQGKDRRGED